MVNPSDDSLGSNATRLGGNKPEERYQTSLGDQSTFGAGPVHGDTMLESDMEIVDLASRYTIEGPLGKGGMGEVLLATDNRLKRKVAIKRIRSDKALSPLAMSRFLTEAQSIASLNHFNIVQVHDYGRDKDGPFLIMEYVDGSSLLDRCKSGPIPLEEAIDITCQLCDGLGRAHELGIIHRDIKPANILLTKDNKPKLTDFGLAKQDTADHSQTIAGAVLGTLDFMPPEQRRDVALTDARSDLWSLAATFYQMVTGRSPKIIRFDRLPSSLTSILGKALEEDKADRYQSASEFRDALISRTNQTTTVPVPDADLGTGECPSCHTKNESHRKFCRECATSLRVDCLSCKVEIPVWDKVCAECGAKQAELVAARRAEMELERQKAEDLRNQHAFHEAFRTARSIATETDSRLQHLKSWAETFAKEMAEEKARQEEFAKKQYTDAQTLRKTFDYSSAIHAMESIPVPIRTHEMSELLRQLTTEHLESTQLLETIAEGVENQQLIGLQELLNRATELRGNDEVVINLQKQLTDQLKNKERRESTQLLETIAERIKNQELDGLQELLNRATELRGNDEVVIDLQKQLTDQLKNIVQRDTIYFDAERLFEQGKAQGARIALKKAPKIELKANQQEFKDRIESIVATELRLAAAFKEAMADGVLEPAEVINLLQISYDYLKLNPNHETICLRNKQLIDRVLKTPSVYRDFFVTMPTEQFLQLPTEVLSKVPADVFSTLPAKVLSKLPLVVNSLGMALKRIPVGTFQMGGGDESHEVTLTRPYYLGVYEVTQEEYELVMGTNPSKFQGARNPVEQVSWDEAVSFCKKLSELADEKKAGRVYHLPTEAEWEYACRAGTTTAYSFGDISEGFWDGVDDDGNEIGGRFYEGDQDEHAWSKSNSEDRTHPVGEKRPNSWGLYDMHGNVFEWCQDWNGVISRGSATDPQGPSDGSNRIVRGGSWNNDHTFSGSAFRFNALPSRRSSCLGFRVAVHEDSTKDEEDDDEHQDNELLDFIEGPVFKVLRRGWFGKRCGFGILLG